MSNVRKVLIDRIREAGGVYDVAERAGLSPSLLYMFARGETWLSRASVDALRAAGIVASADEWLAAIGVELSAEVAS